MVIMPLSRGGWHDQHSQSIERKGLQGAVRERTDDDNGSLFAIDKGYRPEEREVANCIEARENRELSKRRKEGTLICWKLK